LQANPWALHGIVERLLEAVERLLEAVERLLEAESRGMWAKPDPAVLGALRQLYLETEGDL
jgi:cobaltochelatase CobN